MIALRRVLPDAVLPTVVLAFTLWELAQQDFSGDQPALYVAEAVVANVALVFRRRATLAAVGVVALAGSLLALTTTPPESAGSFMTLLLATYSIASYATGPRRVVGSVALLGTIGVYLSQDPLTTSLGAALPTLLIVAFAWAAGLLVRSRADEVDHQAKRVEEMEATREAEARAAAEEEKARIARELHDIIAHNLTTIVVQAGAARLQVHAAPEDMRERLAEIEDTGRRTLGEMRLLLGLVRKTRDHADHEPQPSLDLLEDLAAKMEAAGLPVEVRREGPSQTLPDGLQLSVFRIVQEALTNALRHAGPARAQVCLRNDAQELTVRVVDTGRGHPGGTPGGHGLIGIRERAEMYGGQLTAGNQPGGGFAVEVRFPLVRQLS